MDYETIHVNYMNLETEHRQILKDGSIKAVYSLSTIFLMVWFMVFIATFNNISVISWRSVLLVEETGVPGENHRPVVSQ
jgi:hypothetical protein